MAADSFLGTLALEVAAWLVTYALHSTALLLAALLALALIGRAARSSPRLADAAPAWRERVGKVALLAGIVTSSVQTALGLEPFGLRPALAEPRVVETAQSVPPAAQSVQSAARETVAPTRADRDVAPVSVASSAERAAPAASHFPAVPLFLIPVVALARGAAELVQPATETAAAPARVDVAPPAATVRALPDATSTTDVPWIPVFVALWMLVAAAAFVRRLVGWRTLQATLSGAEPVTDAGVLATFDALCARAGLPCDGARAPRLLVAPLLASPLTRGLVASEVCVPPRALRDLDHDELAALLGHEIAHAQRRDPAWLVTFRALEVVFCLQPLNRIVARRLEDDAELLCDDRAVVWTGDRLPLASCLTEVAGWLVPAHRGPRLAFGMAAHGARLSRRVERLVDASHSPDAGRRRPVFTAVALALAGSTIAIVPGFAAQRTPKPLPLDLQLELAFTRAPSPAPARAHGIESETVSAPAVVTDGEPMPEPCTDAVESAESAAAPLVATTPAFTDPVATPGGEHRALSFALPSGSLLADPFEASFALTFEPPPQTPLAPAFAELQRELSALHALASERAGGESLHDEIDALARRIEALRTREAALAALLALRTNTHLSPATNGRSAEES